jgi:hypothetical protein
MVAVREITWEEASAPDFGNPTRQAWREAVAEIAERAKATLPQCNGRVEKAVAIVLAGEVELLEGGKAKVASQSNGTTKYFVVNGTCECRDFPKAPSGWCKHRIAAGMAKRATPLAKAKLDAGANGQTTPASQPEPLAQPQASPAVTSAPLPEAPTLLALPEAPASCNVYVELGGRKVQVTLRDSDEERLLSRLAALLRRFPVEEIADTSAPASAVPQEGWCTTHQTQMKRREWGGFSHKTADGWCKGQ